MGIIDNKEIDRGSGSYVMINIIIVNRLYYVHAGG